MTDNGNRLQRGRGHTYRIDGQRVPSVTGVMKMLDKPALIAWAARMSAGYAVDHWDELAGMAVSQRYRLIEDARFERNREAKEKGKRIHSLAEKLGIEGEAQPPEHLVGQVEAVARFLDHWEFTTLATEAAVANTDYLYSGTLDTILESPKLGVCLLDWKTGAKGPYQDMALQLAGYRNCNVRLERTERLGPRGGRSLIDVEYPMIEVDGCYVAKVLPDDVELYPARAEAAEFQSFLYLRELWEWVDHATNPKSDGYDPPIDEPIFPENYQEPTND